MVLLIVDVHGMPRNIRIQRSSGFSELDKAALEAVQHWTFKPELKYGMPTEAEVTIPVSFNLNMLGDDLPIAVSALSNELFRIWLPNGDAFTASLENGNLALEHYAPFKLGPGQHAFPTPPSNASNYAQTLETAYHDAYVAAIHHGEPPFSKWAGWEFRSSPAGLVWTADSRRRARGRHYDSVPAPASRIGLNNWELRDKTGATVKSALLYCYDLPKSVAAAGCRRLDSRVARDVASQLVLRHVGRVVENQALLVDVELLVLVMRTATRYSPPVCRWPQYRYPGDACRHSGRA